jgi:hypothetical protein
LSEVLRFFKFLFAARTTQYAIRDNWLCFLKLATNVHEYARNRRTNQIGSIRLRSGQACFFISYWPQRTQRSTKYKEQGEILNSTFLVQYWIFQRFPPFTFSFCLFTLFLSAVRYATYAIRYTIHYSFDIHHTQRERGRQVNSPFQILNPSPTRWTLKTAFSQFFAQFCEIFHFFLDFVIFHINIYPLRNAYMNRNSKIYALMAMWIRFWPNVIVPG